MILFFFLKQVLKRDADFRQDGFLDTLSGAVKYALRGEQKAAEKKSANFRQDGFLDTLKGAVKYALHGEQKAAEKKSANFRLNDDEIKRQNKELREKLLKYRQAAQE